ncbi:hypothetical protein [Opitutus sp. ER46]|uniref:hypothetical protein n=1 Tax=Opitutus sp. ER46 TaxID=2161864 RepID=UPI000D30A51B|nr:hypothetical protein [Opitutus sp. ER46]PTX90944.1 hypothetical protein DB354_20045 [Opitutus sp. ER46]
MSAPAKLSALRRLLADRFPSVPGTGAEPLAPPARGLPTGIPAIDDTAGGLPLSAVTELVCAAPSCGSQLLIGALLSRTRTTRTRVALVDSADSFDPESFPPDHLAHLLWVRCRQTAEALQAVDLLARDANLGLVVLDLRLAPEADLRRTPATQWYRLQRAVEPADLALVVVTPRAAVPSAQLRLVLETSQPTAAWDEDRAALTRQLAPARQRQRRQLLTGTG